MRDKALTVAELTVTCAAFPSVSLAAGDVWGFTPGADTVSNVCVAHGAGDGSCQRVQLCCPAVELEDDEEEEEDKDL